MNGLHELNRIIFELLRSQHMLLIAEMRSRGATHPDEKDPEVAMPQFLTHRHILDQLGKLKAIIHNPKIDQFIHDYIRTLSGMYGDPLSASAGGASLVLTRTAEVRDRRVELVERLSGMLTSLMQFLAAETEGAALLGYWSFADTLFDALTKSGWAMRKLPPILESNEEPPAWRTRAECGNFQNMPEENYQGPIDFESVLGIYRPASFDIVIYRRGVLWAADTLHISEAAIFSVVAIHELSHWAVHCLGPSKSFTFDTAQFTAIGADTHEMLAQLMTFWVATLRHGAFQDAFERLNRRQSDRYRRFKDYETIGPEAILSVLDTLRSRGAFDLSDLESNGIKPSQPSAPGNSR